MENLKIKVNNEEEAEEAKRLAIKAGYTLDDLFRTKWSDDFCYLLLCKDMSAGFGNEIMADGDKPLSMGELRAMVNPMKIKEYLDANRNYKFVLSDKKDDGFIEIPDGAEALIKYQGKGNGNFIKFGHPSLVWMGESWSKVADGFHGAKDYINDGDKIVWQRATQPEELPFIDDEPKSLNDQYAEIEQVRQHRHYFKDVSNLDDIDVYMVLKLFNVTDPCLQHIAKKALCAGQRGHKDFERDLQDILDTAKRAIEINKIC